MYKIFITAFILGFLMVNETSADVWVFQIGVIDYTHNTTWNTIYNAVNHLHNADWNNMWEVWAWRWVYFVGGTSTPLSINGFSPFPFPWLEAYNLWNGTFNNGLFSGYPAQPAPLYIEKINWFIPYITNNKFYSSPLGYFCIYSGLLINDSYFHYFNNAITADCASYWSWFPLLLLPNAWPQPSPPTWPVTTTVNGLTCTTKQAPDLANATWHNFGTYPYLRDKSSTGALFYLWELNQFISDDLDIVRYTLIDDYGLSKIPEWSISWTNTGAKASLIWNWELEISGRYDGDLRKFNVIQVWGVSFTYGQTLPIRYQDLSGTIRNWTATISGAILTIGFPQFARKVWISGVSKFSGIRLGVAEYKEVKTCSVSGAVCTWKFIGTDLSCSATGLLTGSCVVAGSGSLYGSGSCVPLADSNGVIIPHVPITWVNTQYDALGNIIGTSTSSIPDVAYFDGVFSCGFVAEDDWWVTIWKSLICPITVVKNIVWSAWTNVSDAVDGLKPLGDSITKLDSVSGAVAIPSGWSEMTKAFQARLDWLGKGNAWIDKVFNFVWWGMILSVALFLIGLIIFFLKNNNK